MSSEFLPDSRYKFVSGHGDVEHELRLSEAAAKGYRVKLISHGPDGAGGQSLVVLMEMEQESKNKSYS